LKRFCNRTNGLARVSPRLLSSAPSTARRTWPEFVASPALPIASNLAHEFQTYQLPVAPPPPKLPPPPLDPPLSLELSSESPAIRLGHMNS
jgi:hypothetical protein